MKKALRITIYLLGGLLIIILLGAAFIHTKGVPKYDNKAPELEVPSDSARIASMVCRNCHLSEDGKLGGAKMDDTEALGVVYSSNITRHPDYGITQYTDGELSYLLRTGIKKDGLYAPPWMPKFPNLSDYDIESIIAFLKSDHPLVQPSENNPPPFQPSFLAKALTNLAMKPLPYPEAPIPTPDTQDQIAFGKYLSTAKFECFSCHSPDFSKVNELEPERTEGFFSGGNKFTNRAGEPVLSSNLTMDPETGLGNWTKEQFVLAVKTGIRPDAPPIQYPMPPFAAMTDEEAGAIWAYLQTVPVIH